MHSDCGFHPAQFTVCVCMAPLALRESYIVACATHGLRRCCV